MSKPVILVADDMPINFFAIEELLEHAGCLPVLAANGKQALEKFRATNFSLILMDFRMPIMNGLEATRLIRHHERTQIRLASAVKYTPIVMLSASLDERHMAREAGCDDYLLKPLDRDMLLSVLTKHLGIINQSSRFTHAAPDIRQATAQYLRIGSR